MQHKTFPCFLLECSHWLLYGAVRRDILSDTFVGRPVAHLESAASWRGRIMLDRVYTYIEVYFEQTRFLFRLWLHMDQHGFH